MNDNRKSEKKKILVVDDDPDVAIIIKKGLEKNGFEVDVFNDPEEALAKYKAGSYDLLAIDIRMPRLNGFELYKRIRKLDEKVKVCFITAFEMYYDEFKKVFPNLDVKCFIKKPVTIQDLVLQVNAELESYPVSD